MDFGSENTMKLAAERVGFILAYFLFTGLLFAILILAHKLPENWNLLHVSMITLAITVIGGLIKLALR
jgi:hypothetical protein